MEDQTTATRMRTRRAWLAANLLFPVAIALFALGFFPYKPFIPGIAALNDELAAPAPFDKVIFMVVDALRSDFVYADESGFEFTQELIRSGAAVPFTAHAGPPTITMPRVKALTTGSVPSFVDVLLNFAESDTSSTLQHQDTWLAQLRHNASASATTGGSQNTLVMFGDDTWLKLFPDTFARHDGTTSFFVSDFTQVDRNVSRHLPAELGPGDPAPAPDWSAMVLHFLGLDHIGHKAGPRSPHMLPKQREMDAVVRAVYEAMAAGPRLARALLVLCGDHGMNDAGNHGGSSEGETSPALVFVSPLLRRLQRDEGGTVPAPAQPRSGAFQYYETVEQVDVAPTLAGLLNLAVPTNSLGAFIPALLPLWRGRPDLQRRVLLRNARQLAAVVRARYPAFDALQVRHLAGPAGGDSTVPCDALGADDQELACLYARAMAATAAADAEAGAIVGDGSAEEEEEDTGSAAHAAACAALLAFLRAAQRVLSSAATNYNVRYMLLAIGLAGAAALLALVASWPVLFPGRVRSPKDVPRDGSSESESARDGSSLFARVYFLATTAGYAGMMIASSYVEEEQQFWHWVLSGWAAYIFVKRYFSPESFTCVGVDSRTDEYMT
ncbi:major facilitator super transporter protein [Ascosphaera acerosa]|nr:major facilitator super transporter protein [Ascosphaera acerosa]